VKSRIQARYDASRSAVANEAAFFHRNISLIYMAGLFLVILHAFKDQSKGREGHALPKDLALGLPRDSLEG
jgi:hypothetical protein